MRKIISIFIGVVCSMSTLAQINFESDHKYIERFHRADSAIKANEFGIVHSLVVVQNGKLIFENYYNGWKIDSLHQLQSATKSVIATLLGCALQKGLIGSVEEKLIHYFPENYFIDSLHKTITIKDLVTQRHGLKWKEDPWDSPDNTWRKVIESSGDWYNMILKTPMDVLPGTVFNYSNAAPVLTSGIIQNASGMNIDEFAINHLFNPLEISKYWIWPGNGGPQNNGLALISLTSRDMAKLGQLYLQNGKWRNQQIIQSGFIHDATSEIVKDVGANGFYENYSYGYLWWSNPKLRGQNGIEIEGVYMARGAFGQNIIVWPAKQLVVVITAWNMQQPNKPQVIFDKYIAVIFNY